MPITASALNQRNVLVQVDLDDPTPGTTITVYRVDATAPANREAILGARNLPQTTPGHFLYVFDDMIAPIGRPIYYVAEYGNTGYVSQNSNTTTVSSTPTRGIPGTACLITDPYRGLVVPVIVVDNGDTRTVESRGKMLNVPRRRTRIAVMDVAGPETITPQYLTEVPAIALDEILRSGTPFHVRYSCPYLDDTWLQPTGGWSHTQFGKRTAIYDRRLWTLGPCDVLDGPPDPDTRAAGDTLAHLDQAVNYYNGSTLQAIYNRWPTNLLQIATARLSGIN